LLKYYNKLPYGRAKAVRKLAFVFALLILAISVNTALGLPGSGTQEEPWRIESPADFNEFAADPNYWDDYTRLDTDVNLAGQTYSTAVIAPDTDNSNWSFDGLAFTGVFDGNSHKIKGLTINDGGAGNDFLGLFGYIDGGEVRNLGLEGGSVSGEDYIGGLVGFNYYGSVSNCHSTCDVSGDDYVGGLVGGNGYGTISNCYSTGDVSGYDGVGGLVGSNSGSVSNCHSTGDVNGVYYVGGLVGWNYHGSVSNCYSTGDVSGTKSIVGGLVGENWHGSISNCYSSGAVSGKGDVGGLVGWNQYGSISNCSSTGGVSGDDLVGGLVGENWHGSISNCYSIGDVNGTDQSVGGLVGFDWDGSISNCYSRGAVSGEIQVGGLMGVNLGNVSNCYSTGDVDGERNVGGLVGSNFHGSISNCYSSGDVEGADYVGGLVGWKLYGIVSNCIWDTDTQTHGVTESIGYNEGTVTNVEGLSTTEMQDINTYLNAGWDFVGETANGTDDIWLICQGRDYPRLWWQFPLPVLEAEPQESVGTSNIIMWSEVSDANAYYWVECAEDANFEYVVDSSGWINETSYVFFGLETGVTYWYRVKAGYYCDIESRWSNVESSTQVQLADAVLALLDPNDVKNENMLRSLANKLDAIQAMMDKGQYKAAISKLENDILQKTDGCAEIGAPDKNDWITTCERQELVYPIIIEIIELLSDG